MILSLLQEVWYFCLLRFGSLLFPHVFPKSIAKRYAENRNSQMTAGIWRKWASFRARDMKTENASYTNARMQTENQSSQGKRKIWSDARSAMLNLLRRSTGEKHVGYVIVNKQENEVQRDFEVYQSWLLWFCQDFLKKRYGVKGRSKKITYMIWPFRFYCWRVCMRRG